jgi:hypothetical protein
LFAVQWKGPCNTLTMPGSFACARRDGIFAKLIGMKPVILMPPPLLLLPLLSLLLLNSAWSSDLNSMCSLRNKPVPRYLHTG